MSIQTLTQALKHTANATWGVILVSSFKAESWKLKRFFSLKRGKSDVRALNFEFWNSIRKCFPKWDWLYIDTYIVCLSNLFARHNSRARGSWHRHAPWTRETNIYIYICVCVCVPRVCSTDSEIVWNSVTWLRTTCGWTLSLAPVTCAHIHAHIRT